MQPGIAVRRIIGMRIAVIPIAALLMAGLSGCGLALMAGGRAISGAVTAMQAEKERSEVEAGKKPEMTQLQIREVQTRTYEEKAGRAKIMQVALTVLQDDGFVVQNANAEMGLLAASKNLHEKTVDDASTAFMKGFLGGGSVSTQKWSTIEATLTVTPFGDKLRVRLSARLSATDSGGGTRYEAVTEPVFYRDFFTKLEKGLFIEREKL